MTGFKEVFFMDENSKHFDWVCINGSKYKSDFQNFRAQGLREELEWIKRQLEYAYFSERFKLRYDLKRGEIYEIDWGLNVNAEFSSRHYGVVLADSNPFNPLVLVCPLKTKHQEAHPRSDIDLGYVDGLNTTNDTLAVANQIRTVDKLRIFTKNAIGLNVHRDNDDSTGNTFVVNSVPRLNDDKVQLIINHYIMMIVNGHSDA